MIFYFCDDEKILAESLFKYADIKEKQKEKLFFVFFLENIFNKIEYDENIFYIFIAYLTKQRDNFEIYLEANNIEKIDLNGLKSFFVEKDKYMEIFLDVTSRYKFENIKKFRSVLLQYFKKEFDFNEDLKNVLKISGE